MTFSIQQKQDAWNKAQPVPEVDSSFFRKDACGALIRWDMYGVQDSEYGWEIDHIFPKSLGGDENPINLRALHHANNASKGNDYPSYESVVSAEEGHNRERRRYLVINEKIRVELKKIYKDA